MNASMPAAVFFFFCTALCQKAFAKDKESDSLQRVIASNPHDSIYIDSYTRLSVINHEISPVESVRFGMAALARAEAYRDPIRIARACQSIGVGYDYADNLDSCLFFLNRAVRINREAKLPDKESHVISDIALAHYLRGNYELALRNHLEALRLRNEYGEKRFIAISNNNIGLVYRSRKEYKNAIKYYTVSLALKQEINDQRGILNTLINIGSAYQSNNQFDSSLAYAKRAFKLADSLNLEVDILAAQSNMAAALVNLSQIDKALPLLKASEAKALEIGDRNSLLTIYESFGDALKKSGKNTEADEMYKRGLRVATGNSRREYMEVYLRKLATLDYLRGNYQSAYDFSERGRIIRDSLWNQENSRQINEMSAVYESAEKEKKIESLNIENQLNLADAGRRKRERNYFVLATFLLLGSALVAYLGYSSNRKKKNILNRQNMVIEQQLKEKEFLLKEIHHRVKNNLQIVSSLLNLQAKYIRDEHALDAVRDSRNRVHSMAMIHQNLYQEENLAGINMQEYITLLCENLFHSYNIHEQQIKLKTDIEPLILDVDLVVPLGLIMNELITNSLKYAFPDLRKGMISISLQEKQNKIILTVSDDGIGFPDPEMPGKKGTFGSKLVHAFVQKLNADMRSFNRQGAVVEISFIHPANTRI